MAWILRSELAEFVGGAGAVAVAVHDSLIGHSRLARLALALFNWQFPTIDIRRAGEEISAANATGEAAMRRVQLRGPGGVPTLARRSARLKHSLARAPPWTRRRQIPRSLSSGKYWRTDPCSEFTAC
jgi:hypothetical protein